MRLIIQGGLGRMGKVVVEVAEERGIDTIVVDKNGDLKNLSLVKEGDLVLDFSTPEGTREAVEYCQKRKIPLVSGTTGFDPEEMFTGAKKDIPILYAPNFSPGVNLLFFLLKSMPEKLKKHFSASILEIHHSGKKDRPSGTAKRLADIIEGEDVFSIRAGDEHGTHTIFFIGEGETIEITHRARNRRIFAIGAIEACIWIMDKPPGLYSMEDVWSMKK